MDIITGVDLGYSGEGFIDGINRREYKNEDNSISYVMFKPVLFEGKSVFKNLLYVYKVKDKKYNKANAVNEIKEISKELGITNLLNKKAKKLSRFEKELVSFARIMIKKPKLIVVDEPLFYTQGVEKNTLVIALKSIAKKLSSVVVVAEKVENLPQFEDSRVLRMDGGKVF